MNKVTSFLLGLLAGGTISYWLTNYFMKDKYSKIASEQVNEVIQYYEGSNEPEETEITTDLQENSQSDEVVSSEPNETKTKAQVVDYSAKSKQVTEMPKTQPPENDQSGPHRVEIRDIIADDYRDDAPLYEEIKITTDEVFIDEDDFIIERDFANELFGKDNLDAFLQDRMDASMYIRNPDLGQNFAIGKIMESYDEYADHIPESKRYQNQ